MVLSCQVRGQLWGYIEDTAPQLDEIDGESLFFHKKNKHILGKPSTDGYHFLQLL